MFIEISEKDFFQGYEWKMSINLEEICKEAGKRKKDKYTGETYTPLKIPEAKRIIKLIEKYAEESELEKAIFYIKNNNEILLKGRKRNEKI